MILPYWLASQTCANAKNRERIPIPSHWKALYTSRNPERPVIGFPLLIIPFAIYNMIAFLTPGVSWSGSLYTFHLRSGLDWSPTAGDALLVFSLLMLLFEFIKS